MYTVRKRLSKPDVIDIDTDTPLSTPVTDDPAPIFMPEKKGPPPVDFDLEDHELQCSIFGWRPRWLQPYNNMKVFLCCFTCLTIFRGITYSYFSAMLPSMEKRFGFSSQSIGTVKAMGDVSHLMSALIIAHFGGAGHRPRWMAGGTLMVGMGFLLMSATEAFFPPSTIPSLAAVLSVSSDASEPLCNAARNTTISVKNCAAAGDANYGPLIVLGLAEFVCGLGSTAALILGMPFVDDNVKNKDSPLYFAMTISGFIFGPILGYALAAAFNTIYFDFSHPDFGPTDPRWVSAWHLGFIISGLGSCFMGLIISCFPPIIGKSAKRLANIELSRGKETLADVRAEQIAVKKPKPVTLKDLPVNLKRLLTNSLYMTKLFGQLLNSFALTGYTSFTQKFLKEQYQLPQSVTNLAGGLPPVFAGVLGIALGSVFIRHYKLNPRQICCLMASCSFVAAGMYLSVIALGCDMQGIIGIDNIADQHNMSSPASCINPPDCNCPANQFSPICDTETNTSYISACAAGCTESRRGKRHKDVKYYFNCKCTVRNLTDVDGSEHSSSNFTLRVKGGVCPKFCSNFVNYVIVMTLATFLLGFPVTGLVMVQFRIVDIDLKSLASGLSTIVMSALGMLPAPIVLGKLIDSSCRLWQTDKCGTRGACWIYNADEFRWKLHALVGGVRLISMCIELTVAYKVRNLTFDRNADHTEDVTANSSQLDLTTATRDEDDDAYPPELQDVEVWAETRRRSIFISDALTFSD